MAKLLPHLILQTLDFYGQSAKLCLAFLIHPTSEEAFATGICVERHLVDKDLSAKKVPRTQWHILAVKMARHTLS